MNRAIIGYLTTSALLLAPLAHSVRAETLNCTPVTSLPATISTQGIHCLTGNLGTNIASGIAIEITVNNVTLDLNGWKVGGQAAGSATQATGIFSSAANVTIKNGIVRGFRFGIDLAGRGAVVEDLLVDQNTNNGIIVEGQGAIVRRNRVIDTGGATTAANVAARGIEAFGPGSLIESNFVSGLEATGSFPEEGIRINAPSTLVRNNFITDAVQPTGGSIGIDAVGNANINILGNTVSNMKNCISYQGGATGIFANNTVTGCDTTFSGGTAGQQGNNF